jgi:hypothetical protein
MQAAGFDHAKFPKAAPKLMGLGTVRAVLKGKYGPDITELLKLKLNSLQDLLSPQLALLRNVAAGSAD